MGRTLVKRLNGWWCPDAPAAELVGATVNQFVVQTAYVEAQRVLERESLIRLSQKDARKVLSLLDDPPSPNRRLKEAVRAFKDSVRA